MQKRYWLRGGITGFVIGILGCILINFIPPTVCMNGHEFIDCPISAFGIFSYNLRHITFDSLGDIYSLILLIPILIGILVGWLYGKIRKASKAS